jgi:hypothetical protein
MQQWIFFTLLHSRSAANDDDGGFFREGFRRGVGDLEAADTVGDANRSESAHTRIGISGEAGALFIAGIDDAQLAFRKLIVKSEDVIAWNPEYVPHTVSVESVDEVGPNGR